MRLTRTLSPRRSRLAAVVTSATALATFGALGLGPAPAQAVQKQPGVVGCPASAPPQVLSQQYKTDVEQALASPTDVWGEQAINSPGGPTYDNLTDHLKPLMYAIAPATSGGYLTDSGVYYLPFGQPTGLDEPGHVALHVADGSEIMSDKTGYRSTHVYVGEGASERYGECLADLATPALLDGYLPVLETSYRDYNGISYTQESFAADLPGTDLLASYVKLTAQRGGSDAQATKLRFQTCDCGLSQDGDQLVKSGSTYLYFSPGAAFSGRDLVYDVDLADGLPHSVYIVRLNNATTNAPAIAPSAAGHDAARQADTDYWNARLDQGATFAVPEQRVMDAERNLLIQNMLLTWRYSLGNAYDEFHQPESSEAVEALGDFGFTDAYKASLQTLLPMTKGARSRDWEIGEKLLHAADYYWLTKDQGFIQDNNDAYVGYVEDLAQQHANDPNHLLERQRYSSDINHDVYGLHQIGTALLGLKAMVTVWDQIGRPDLAQQYAPLAASLDKAFHDAIKASQVTMSDGSLFTAVDLLDGIQPWDPITATKLGGYWNLVAPFGFSAQAYKPGSQEAQRTLQYLFDHGSRLLGLVRARDSAVDPVYNVEQSTFLADNDQADQLVLSLYGDLAAGMTQNTFVSGEAANIGPIATKWPKQAGVCQAGQPCTPPTVEDGWAPDEYYRAMYLPPNGTTNAFFLHTLHLMLVNEPTAVTKDAASPGGLQLAFFTPRGWLADGKDITVTNAPTSYGPLSYAIQSHLATNQVTASVTVPTRSAPPSLVLRLRVPTGKQMIAVTVNGKPYINFNPHNETIDLSQLTGTLQIQVTYHDTPQR